jgi:hypothetical protein
MTRRVALRPVTPAPSTCHPRSTSNARSQRSTQRPNGHQAIGRASVQDRTHRSHSACAREAPTGRAAELTGRGTPDVRFEYRKGPESDFVDRMRPVACDWTHPGVRSILPFVLLPWVRDRTRRWQTQALRPACHCCSVELTGRVWSC